MLIDEVEPRDLIAALREVERRGALEIAKRNGQNCSRIFKYANVCGYTRHNPAVELHQVLQPREQGHFAAIEAAQLPDFVRAMYAYEACMGLPTQVAMRLMLQLTKAGCLTLGNLINCPLRTSILLGNLIVLITIISSSSSAVVPTTRG